MTAERQERIPEWTRGDRLRKARLTTGMSARDFAAYIGVSHGTVSNGEGDKHEVRKITINAYAAATGVPVEWLEHGIVVSDPDPDEGKSVDGGSDAVSQLAARKRSRTTRHAEGDTDRYLWAEPVAA